MKLLSLTTLFSAVALLGSTCAAVARPLSVEREYNELSKQLERGFTSQAEMDKVLNRLERFLNVNREILTSKEHLIIGALISGHPNIRWEGSKAIFKKATDRRPAGNRSSHKGRHSLQC